MKKTFMLILLVSLYFNCINAQTTQRVSNFFIKDSIFQPFFISKFFDKVYFVDYSSSAVVFANYDLWEYDGFNQPKFIARLNADYIYGEDCYFGMQPVVFKNKLYFSGENYRLYAYDGINPAVLVDSLFYRPAHLHVFNDTLYFTATTSTTGRELFKFDGENPPELWLDMAPGIENSNPRLIQSNSETLYFTIGDTIWQYSPIHNLLKVPNTGYTFPNNLFIINNTLHFTANDGKNYAIWQYVNGNSPIKFDDTILGEGYSIIDGICYNNSYYFRAATPQNFLGDLYKLGYGLVPEKVKINNSNGDEYFGAQPHDFHIFNDVLFYTAGSAMFGPQYIFTFNGYDNASHFELMESYLSVQNPEKYFTLNDSLYFFATDVFDGYALYKLIFHPKADKYLTECKQYAAGSEIYDTTGIYKYFVPATSGPDSLITLYLNILNPNVEVIQTDSLLEAFEGNAEYAWLNKNYTVISGENDQRFIATKSGKYALIINQNGCTDTSKFYSVNLWAGPNGLRNTNLNKKLSIKHFISDEVLHIEFEENPGEVFITLASLRGDFISNYKIKNENSCEIPLDNFPAGFYLVQIKNGEWQETIKIVIW